MTGRTSVQAYPNENPNDQHLGNREEQDVEKVPKSGGMSANAHGCHNCAKEEYSSDH